MQGAEEDTVQSRTPRRTKVIASIVAFLFLGGGSVCALGGTLLWSWVASDGRVPYEVPTEEAVLELGTQLDSAIHGETARALSQLIDMREMAYRGLPEDYGFRRSRAFARGVEEGHAEHPTYAQLARVLRNGGTVTFRGVVTRDGRPVARFRVLPVDGGVNFTDFVPGQRPDGTHRVVDLFNMATGSYASESIRELATNMSTPGAARRLTALTHAHREGTPEDVLAAYRALNDTERASSSIQTIRLIAASALPDDVYAAALDDAMARTRGSAAVVVTSIDAHVLREDYPAALHATGLVAADFPDPYWNVMRANILVSAGDLDAAAARISEATSDEPSMFEAQDARLYIALLRNDTEIAAAALRLLRDEHGVDLETLAAMPDYEAIAASPELMAIVNSPPNETAGPP